VIYRPAISGDFDMRWAGRLGEKRGQGEDEDQQVKKQNIKPS
jgi:hypothetical protein